MIKIGKKETVIPEMVSNLLDNGCIKLDMYSKGRTGIDIFMITEKGEQTLISLMKKTPIVFFKSVTDDHDAQVVDDLNVIMILHSHSKNDNMVHCYNDKSPYIWHFKEYLANQFLKTDILMDGRLNPFFVINNQKLNFRNSINGRIVTGVELLMISHEFYDTLPNYLTDEEFRNQSWDNQTRCIKDDINKINKFWGEWDFVANSGPNGNWE